MWKSILAATLLIPSFAHAADQCKFQAPRNESLNLAGVHTLVIELGQHNLHLNGGTANSAEVRGRACASSSDRLDTLRLVQRREGDRLILSTDNDTEGWSINLFGWSSYAYLDLQVDVPSNLAVELKVGSGDADVAGIDSLEGRVGSGDLRARNINGRFDASVGSGDIVAKNIGEIHVASLGSGDFTVEGVRGNVEIGSIGSGDAALSTVGGNVVVDSIGSGDLSVNDVAHDLRVHSVGSGDVSHHRVAGHVDIPSDD